MTILEQLADYAKERVAVSKRNISLSDMTMQALSLPKGDFAFENALKKSEMSFICECKKASPSKGIIANDFPYLSIAKEYEECGADCISVLTEPKWFLGSDKYLQEIASSVKIPCLRKDFTVDEYMIYQAKTLGATAVLLICSILDDKQLKDYLDICDGLGLSSIVETHNENEIESALKVGSRIIGVNNRNLKDFSVDIENSAKLRALVPNDIIFVSESGITTPLDVKHAKDIGCDAVLMGEVLMRAKDKKAKLLEMKSLL